MLREIDTYQKIRKTRSVNKESLTTRSFSSVRSCEPDSREPRHRYTSRFPFNGVDNRAAEFLRNSRTAETPSQTPSPACNRRIGISSSMYHNGTLAGTVVNTFFQPVQDEGISVPALIGCFCQIESQGTFIRSVFIGK